MKCVSCFLAIVFTTFSGVQIIRANSIILTWNASTSPDIAGYHVYFGTTRGNYSSMLDVGNVKTATVSNLTGGETYYFAATAYNAAGTESPYSTSIQFLIPQESASLQTTDETATDSAAAERAPAPASATHARIVRAVDTEAVAKKSATTTRLTPTTATVTAAHVQSAARAQSVAHTQSESALLRSRPDSATVNLTRPAQPRTATKKTSVPASLALTHDANHSSLALLKFPVEAGHWYEVQASSDFQRWDSIWQSDTATEKGSRQFADSNSASINARFYRIILH